MQGQGLRYFGHLMEASWLKSNIKKGGKKRKRKKDEELGKKKERKKHWFLGSLPIFCKSDKRKLEYYILLFPGHGFGSKRSLG